MISQYLDYVCIGFCVLHMIFEIFSNKSMQKKIVSLCTKCFHPVYQDEDHSCDQSLTSVQLNALVAFVQSLKSSDKEVD